jgi:hypothetical protein
VALFLRIFLHSKSTFLEFSGFVKSREKFSMEIITEAIERRDYDDT